MLRDGCTGAGAVVAAEKPPKAALEAVEEKPPVVDEAAGDFEVNPEATPVKPGAVVVEAVEAVVEELGVVPKLEPVKLVHYNDSQVDVRDWSRWYMKFTSLVKICK